MITHDVVRHNTAPRGARSLLGILLVFLSLALAACSRDTGSAARQDSAPGTGKADCPLTCDTSAWKVFEDIADRVAAGQDVPRAEFEAFGELPGVALWSASFDKEAPSAQRIGNWVEGVFWEKLGRQGEQKKSSDRTDFLRSTTYSLDHRDRIDARLDELTGPRRCEMDSLIRYWIAPENLPREISIHFLPARPEIRILNGDLLVDTGVVGAASVAQVIRNTASLMFRRFQTIQGPNPAEVEGPLAIAHAIRVLMNEGVAGWIDKAAHLEFDGDHPSLYKVKIIPEDFFLKAQEAVGLMNRHLGTMLDDEADMARRGRTFAEHLAAMNAYSQTGYAMSAVISGRLGEDRLREASRSVAGFLAAYQEAALLNPVPAPVPGALGQELFETVPPLEPRIYTGLHALLTGVFPD